MLLSTVKVAMVCLTRVNLLVLKIRFYHEFNDNLQFVYM